jgi:ABC-type antimicrobial peptide transport system permease subunit
MRLHDIIFRNLRRRVSRKALLVAGLAIGVATVVALIAITATMQADVANKLDEYGANILIVSLSEQTSQPISARLWTRRGLPVAIATCIVGSLLFYIFYDYLLR